MNNNSQIDLNKKINIEQVVLLEEELLSTIDENISEDFLEEKHKMVSKSYKELVSDDEEEIGLLDIENISLTINNSNILITPKNLILELSQILGFSNEDNKKILSSKNYANLYNNSVKIIKDKIKLIQEIESLEDFKKYDQDIYDYIKSENIKESRLKYEVKSMKQSIIDELRVVYKNLAYLFEKGEIDVTSKLDSYFDKEKIELLINAKRLKNVGTIKNDDFYERMNILTKYFTNIIRNKENVIVKIDINGEKELYDLETFKFEYLSLFNELINDSRYSKKMYHIFNENMLKKIELISKEENDLISNDWKIENNIGFNNSKKINNTSIDKEQLLKDKKELFLSTEYMYKIKGINKMSGYNGYIYENGKVIFEKYYKDKYNNTPTINEAIYVMTVDNFLELIALDKSYIIKYINNDEHKTVKRIFHSGKWQEKVKEEIEEETNYDMLSVDFMIKKKIIDQKINILKEYNNELSKVQLSHNKNKIIK